MSKKYWVSLYLFFLLSIPSYASCPFGISNQNCEVYSNGNGTIILEDIPQNEITSAEVKIINKNNIDLVFDSQNISPIQYQLTNPIQHSGEYEILANGYNSKNEQIFSGSHSIVIDLYQPQPPLINPFLISSTVKGKGEQPGDKIIAYDYTLSQIIATATVEENLSFTLDLGINSPSFVSFIAKSQTSGIESVPVMRYVYDKKLPPYKYKEVSTITLREDIITTVNKINPQGVTSQRNFYVYGETQNEEDGSLIYVNGQRVQIIENTFGAFIELNVGKNIIEIRSKSGEVKDSFEVNYDNSKFFFEEISLVKVFENSFTISGKTSTKDSFLVYVNGNYIADISPQADNTFSFTGTSPQRSKVVVEFFGKDNSYESFILYKDLEKPKVSSYHFNNLLINSSLLFSISDDVGLNYSSIKLNLGDDIQLNPSYSFGNFFVFETNSLASGTYQYTLEGSDLYGRKVEGDVSNTIIIDQNISNFKIQTENGNKVFGDTLFLKSNSFSLKLNTLDALAFKHILVDGKDLISYNIKNKNLIEINSIEVSQLEGTLEFEYIDKQNNLHKKTYNYIVDSQPVILQIDSLVHNVRGVSSQPESYVRISGSINHPLFDWSSFYINGNSVPFFTSNNYFEAYVDVMDFDISFSGLSITGNGFENPQRTNILSLDTTKPVIFSQVQNNSLVGLIQNTFPGYEEVISFENSHSKRSFLGNEFIMSLEQRPGLQEYFISGRNQFSLESYDSSSIKLIDYIDPQALIVDKNTTYEVQIQGTHTSINSAILKDMDGNQVSTSSCDPYFYNGECLLISPGLYNIELEDTYGNTNNFSLNIIDEEELTTLVGFEKVYFHGTNLKTSQKQTLLQGNVVTSKPIESISHNGGGNCNFDGINFVCLVENSIGENNHSISINYEDDSSEESEDIVIIRDGENPLTLDVELTSGVQQFGNNYYFFNDDVLALVTIGDSAVLSYYVNGEKVLLGEKNEGENVIALSLDSFIENKEKASLEVIFRAENDDIKETSIFTLIYDTSKELLLDLFIS